MLRLTIAILFLSAPLRAPAADDPAPLWLMVGTPSLTAAAAPLAEHRRAQGMEVMVAGRDIGAALKASPRRPDFLLIVGDDLLGGPLVGGDWVQSKRRSLYRWRSVQAEDYAADPAWGDTDADGLPDFPVGRIPARTPEEVATVVRKTISYESRDLSPADLGLPIWGGTPAYGKLLDEGATTLLLSAVRKHQPDWAEPWMMFGNPRSPLSAHPPDQPAIFNHRIANGGIVASMIGHGGPTLFHSQPSLTGDIDYHSSHARQLGGDAPACPLVIFACDCGSFAGTKPSLAETLLFAPGGPVNVVAATTESHPLTNYYSSLALLGALDDGHERFGTLWQAAQFEGFRTRKRITEALLKNAEGALDAEIDIAKLKLDQLLIYALLGDPATRIPVPRPLAVDLRRDGDLWHWKIREPMERAAVSVAIRRPGTPPRIKPEGSSRDTAMRLFEARNAAWRFEKVGSTSEGTLSGPGRLRIVVTRGADILQFTHELPE